MEEYLAIQVRIQRSIERAITNFKKTSKANLTPAKIRSRIEAVKDVWAQFQITHDKMSRVVALADRPSIEYFANEQFDQTEDNFLDAMDLMREKLEELEPTVSPFQSLASRSARQDGAASSIAHLPPIQLPPFDGNFSEWEQFRDRFTSLISENRDLTDFARMHYLSSCLAGRARECIANLAVTADNFPLAWDALRARYENKRRLLNSHISSLLNLPGVARESAADLQALSDQMNIAVASLKNLNRQPAELWDDVLVFLAVQKLDANTRKAWNIKTSDQEAPPSYAELSRFLSSRIRAFEEIASTPSVKASKSSGAPRVHAATASAGTQSACPLCQANHFINACPTFVSKHPRERRDLIKQHKRCFNCLSAKHAVQSCKSKFSCRTCNKKHHTTLHVPPDADSKSSSAASLSSASPVGSSPPASETNPAVHSLLASVNLRTRSPILLATAVVTVQASPGRTVTVRALVDQGSEMTFISSRIAQVMRAQRIRMPIEISAVGGVHAGTCRHATRISISPRASNSPSFAATALILKSVTSYVPAKFVSLTAFDYLSDLSLADPNPTNSDPIDLIIGADLYSELILDGVRKGAPGQPLAQNSVLGWIISGSVASSSRDPSATNATLAHSGHTRCINAHHCLREPSLDERIQKFWEIEEIPPKRIISPLDEKCERHFRETHSRDSDGRYVVRLPFKEGPPIDIGESKSRAVKVLHSVLRKIHANPPLEREYTEFIAEYEQMGHMRSDFPNALAQNVYLPHHAVMREGSATTHLRVVFNASSVTSNGTSLNEHLLAGPKLQTEISSVILNWRNFQFVYSADIAKMYRQIRVDTRDINFQRILWIDSDSAPVDYCLLTVTYGMSCAPFLALRVLKQLALDDGHAFPKAVPILENNIYVDDVLFGADDPPTLRQTRNQLIALLNRGGFTLRKWASNSADMLSDIDASDHGLACNKSLATDDQLKILGIGWNPRFDAFEFSVALPESMPVSKRMILSVLAKLYDPLGWVTPVTVAAKIFIQRLWRNKLDWDEEIGAALVTKWQEIYSGLPVLNGLRIKRWTGLRSNVESAEIHGFADASTCAYAAAVYLKVVAPSGEVTVTLLAGKSRVAPLSSLTIPRLELCASLLLARLATFVSSSCGFDNLPCYCWTDSTVVLTWISNHPSRWKTFVANRVSEIQTLLPRGEWRHVSTEDNPADCGSRGISGHELRHHPLWWRGPPWLHRPSNEWPSATTHGDPGPPPEEKVVALQCSLAPPVWDLHSRFSSWPKLIRVTAYIMRFIKRCRSRTLTAVNEPDELSLNASRENLSQASSTLALTAVECNAAKQFWIKAIQGNLFANEIRTLSHERAVSAKSSIMSLRPFLDKDGILRVGGRLSHAPFPFAFRHPILLASHPIVDLIIHQAHWRALHSGPQLTLNILRREFWLMRGRSLVKAILFKCIICTRERAAIPTQLMGNLPIPRVSPSVRTFLHCGVDYAGPVVIRASAGRGITSRKAYIALFVCLATKAIHLEIVSDYSTAAFLNAYSRFCARRGLPQAMYSDNGTTFVGADRELTLAYRAAIHDPNFLNKTAADQVTWQFIPPSAPHFGGLWESGVRSMKYHLRRVLGNHTLTYEEFSTLLCRIEACLNSRPLAPISDSLHDFEYLTPGHFLIGSAVAVSPEPSVLNLNENRLSRWQHLRHMTERFWRLWQTDYVNTLQQRAKWKRLEPQVQIGQMVLLRNSLLPPCKWELGRVAACHPGADGLVRVVTVKTATSEFKRPIVKLCVLPVATEATNT